MPARRSAAPRWAVGMTWLSVSIVGAICACPRGWITTRGWTSWASNSDAQQWMAAAFGDGPEQPTPAAPNVVPFRPRRFDRAEHCRRVGAHGGGATVARHGAAQMTAIGRAGARTTSRHHVVAFFRGVVTAKGCEGPREPEFPADLAAGRWFADQAA